MRMSGSQEREHHLHGAHLLEPEEDRWAWRARIRRNPTQLFFYRIGVAIVGLALMIAAGLTGPLPGPGGIPLFLLGLAVWASEFSWAHRLMEWFKEFFRRYQTWRWPAKLGFWLAFAAVCWLLGYVMMLIFGIPPWVPSRVRTLLEALPGL